MTETKAKKPRAAKKPAKTPPASVPEVAVEPAPIVAYKGFNPDWTCRGFQFEVGQTYEHAGDVNVCAAGFHACEYPLHVLRYYDSSRSVFAVVEQSGKLARHSDDSKLASSRIAIKASIDLAGLIKAAVQYTLDRCTPADGATSEADATVAKAEGRHKCATASGEYGAATASGEYGAATASGEYGAATASGRSGAATASGWYGAATASGRSGAATASGRSGAATASGEYGAATASGRSGAATASAKTSTACASGCNGRARGVDGAALFLVYRDANWNVVHAWAGIVGRDGIKPDTWYRLGEDGQPQEVEK